MNLLKINILNDNENGIIQGYINVDEHANGNDVRHRCSKWLEHFDTNELDEIRCVNILRTVSYQEVESFITNLADKICSGGKVIISDIDINFTTKRFVRQQMIIEDYQKALSNLDYFYNMEIVTQHIANNNLKICKKYFDGDHFLIEATK